MSTEKAPTKRLMSLDQFRGYTVAGMFLVNFLGAFAACPYVLAHHNNYCSYADTIMPHFLFAVGFAMRLTFGRRVIQQGKASAYLRMVRRMLGLVLLSIVVYGAGAPAESWAQLTQMVSDSGIWSVLVKPLKREWFQTLMHIAVTSIWILPVIQARAGVRVAYMLLSAIAHIGFSYWFHYEWVNTSPNGIDGGPLGFLTWAIPAMVGTLACDAVVVADGRPRLGKMVLWSIVLMAAGWLISCGTRMYDVPADQVEALRGQKLAADPVLPSKERLDRIDWSNVRSLLVEPPLVPPVGSIPPVSEEESGDLAQRLKKWWLEPVEKVRDQSHLTRKWNYWMMTQRGGSVSYLTFSAGFSLAVYVLFYIVCDVWGLQLGFFRTFGTNAIFAYVLHGLVSDAVKPFIPRDAPGWYVTAGLLVFFWITYAIVRHLEKDRIYIKV